MIDSAGELSGWRVLRMMVPHDIHHRSQIDTYAGLNNWPVPDIYGRSAETITVYRLPPFTLHPRDNNQPAAAPADSKSRKKHENPEKQHVNQTADRLTD